MISKDAIDSAHLRRVDHVIGPEVAGGLSAPVETGHVCGPQDGTITFQLRVDEGGTLPGRCETLGAN